MKQWHMVALRLALALVPPLVAHLRAGKLQPAQLAALLLVALDQLVADASKPSG